MYLLCYHGFCRSITNITGNFGLLYHILLYYQHNYPSTIRKWILFHSNIIGYELLFSKQCINKFEWVLNMHDLIFIYFFKVKTSYLGNVLAVIYNKMISKSNSCSTSQQNAFYSFFPFRFMKVIILKSNINKAY